MGDDPESILAIARRTCLCVSADKLTFEEMKENTPNVKLRSVTKKAALGHIDAFVSHSWHDDPALKWEALQKWREEFKARNQGNEPTLWIDKYCMSLLILCGKTY